MSWPAKLKELKDELIEVTRKLYDRGLSSGTSGNTSARLPGMPDKVLIKASGRSFGEVGEKDFLVVNLDGEVLEGEGKPSKEIRFHLGIYRVRPEVNAVIHGHSPYATAYVTAFGGLPVVTAAAEMGLRRVAVVDFAPPGSEELAHLVIETFRDPEVKAAVLTRHGFVTVGENIRKAYYLADVLEDNAKVACLLQSLKGLAAGDF
ncbi:L-fuculose-phosphate aldolase [Thermanaeromonas toyohensis ToBE]|uniref:L-fuculose-phosphate aldolase n=1 Tax=Thermanaeromonas toyohensis ToBE TaxID=698762 RepID=A0A1W1VBW7_9FIRM|nr:class II aldolase/adducin family protein [Thermanaeromonas toyohensis]SMB90551.1 L-fuculose-phosphate aldolase [Thermanaeromonas toyohensis ToBE]